MIWDLKDSSNLVSNIVIAITKTIMSINVWQNKNKSLD